MSCKFMEASSVQKNTIIILNATQSPCNGFPISNELIYCLCFQATPSSRSAGRQPYTLVYDHRALLTCDYCTCTAVSFVYLVRAWVSRAPPSIYSVLSVATRRVEPLAQLKRWKGKNDKVPLETPGYECHFLYS